MQRLAFVVCLVLAACGGEVPPPGPGPSRAAAANTAAAATPIQAGPVATAAAVAALAATPATLDAALGQLRPLGSEGAAAVLRQADGDDPVAVGNAPLVLVRLGAEAMPAVTRALTQGSLRQRRIAIQALILMGTGAAPALDALAAARNDDDPTVRAGALIAWQRATQDLSDLERQRAEQAAAEARAR